MPPASNDRSASGARWGGIKVDGQCGGGQRLGSTESSASRGLRRHLVPPVLDPSPPRTYPPPAEAVSRSSLDEPCSTRPDASAPVVVSRSRSLLAPPTPHETAAAEAPLGTEQIVASLESKEVSSVASSQAAAPAAEAQQGQLDDVAAGEGAFPESSGATAAAEKEER